MTVLPLLFALAGPLFGTVRYIAQTAGTFSGGAACNGQPAIAPATWNSTSESPGDISYVCGTINAAAGATVLTIAWSGTSSAPIQLIFDTGAIIQAPYLNVNGGIVVSGRSWVTISGGSNGIIQNTLDGTSGQNCPGGTCNVQSDSSPIYLTGCTHCAVENLNIASVYVRASGDTNPYGTGITVNDAGISGASNILIANNTISNAYSGILWLYGTNESGIEIKGNTIGYTNWGIALRAPDPLDTIAGITIHDNNIHDHANWDDYPSPYNNHHTGIYIFGNVTGDAVSGCYVYNNYFHGAFGSGVSPGLYLENVSTGTFTCTAFNNVIAPSSAGSGGKGGLTAQNESSSGPVHLLAYNNTIAASAPSNGPAGIWVEGASMATTLENNIVYGWSYDLRTQTGAAKPTSNSNVWYNGAAPLFNVGGAQYATLAAWQSASGEDAGSISVSPNLNLSTWVPNSGSPVIGVGANLSSLCSGQPSPGIGALCFDKNGGARPSTGNWDAGAYQYGSVVEVTPGLDGFFCIPTSVSPSAGSICTVELTLPAGSGGSTINLNSLPTDVNMSASVTVPQGSTSTNFPVAAGNVATQTPVTLTASLAGINETFGLTVNPAAAALSSVSVSPGTIVSGQSGSGTITLTGAAAAGGDAVTLASSNPAAASVPASVTVLQGATSASFAVAGGSVVSATAVTLTATDSSGSKTLGFTVDAAPVALNAVSVFPSTIVSGQSGTGTVNLTAPAPAGGALVTLSSSNISAATVPASVAVPQSSTSTTFPVGTGSVTTSTPVTLTATYSGGTVTGGLTVNAPPDFAIGMSAGPGSVVAGSSATYTVTVSGNGGFIGTVSFGSPGLPSGVTGSFNPTTVTGSGSTTLTVATTGSASAGGSTITVTGTSGSLNHNTSASLNITGAGPIAVSVTPSSGSGTSQTFSFAFADPNGAGDITGAEIDIAPTLSVSGACYVYYPGSLNELYLASDTGVWQGPLPLGSSGTLHNSQCTLDVGASSAAMPGNTLTLNLALTFTAGFAGTQNVYMEALSAAHDSGWSLHGSWTVSNSVQIGSTPVQVSVTPNTGGGFSGTFAFAFSDSNGAGDIVDAQIDIASTLSVSGACYVYYPRSLNELYLASDTGVWQGPLAVGTSGTLQNSQCTLNVGASSASIAGNTLTLNLALTFTAGFSGAKNVYMEVANATHDSGWSQFGTWTIASNGEASLPPVPVSVTPSSGSGLSHAFAFSFSDGNGAADITSALIDISPTLSVSGACYLYYVRSLNELYLASDSGVWQGPLKLGNAATLQNSQCVVHPATTTVVLSGNTLTLNLPLTFKAAFAGTKNVYVKVLNATEDSGWPLMGTWSVP